MSVQFRGQEYLIGPAIVGVSAAMPLWDHVDDVYYCNQFCPVYRPAGERGNYIIRVQHLNTQWPTFYPMKTKAQLLEKWT